MNDECQARIEARLALMLESARAADVFVTGDQRIAESAAAALIGVSVRTLEGYRTRYGGGPPWVNVGCGDGSRVSYDLRRLAEWLESHVESW